MAQCATTALAAAVPRPCVRGARGHSGGFGPVPGVVSLPFPSSRPACPALRVAGRPVWVSLTLARWYAIPRGLCLPRARSSCPSGSPRLPFACVCARAPAVSAPPPWVVWCAHLARSRHWALVGPFHVVCAPPRVLPRSLALSGVPWGGAARSRFPPTWLGVVGVAEGRPRGGCLPLLRGASGARRSLSPDCPPTGRAVGVRYSRAVGAGLWVWGPTPSPWPARPVGAACRGCGGGLSRYLAWGCAPPVGRVCGVRLPGGGLGGGGAARAPCPPFVRPGVACRAGGRSASLSPSAFPGQATKRVSLASFCPWGARPPIPLQFVLARLHWARSVRRPGALARARLFPAVPVGAAGWGGGAGRAPAPPSGGGRGDHPPCLGGWGLGPPRLAGRWGGWWGGGSRRGLPAPSLGGGPRFSTLAHLLSSAHSPPACACGRGRGAAPGWGGMRDGPWTAPLEAPADLNPPSALPKWAVVIGGSWGARPPYCSGAPPCAAPRLGPRTAPARWCGLACQP